MGLENLDRKLITIIMDKFGGGPVGIDNIAAVMGEDAGTIEDVYEPYLIQLGYINRTPKGRIITELAMRHFRSIK